MITTNFIVSKRKISQENKVPFTGEYNIDKFHFTFDEEWNGLDKTLVIVTDDTHTYNVALLNDEAIVPMEFYQTKGNIIIGVFGTNETEQILATGWLSVYIEDDAYKAGQEPTNLPTQTQWDLFVTEINGLLRDCRAVKSDCEAILLQIQRLKDDVEGYKNTTKGYMETTEGYKDTTKGYMDTAEGYKNDTAELKQQTQGIVDDFNSNVEQKTTDFNNNATQKTNAFNDNATSKTNAYNQNATDKLASYNQNDTNKTNAYNQNATDKTTAFNDNAISKTGDFDSNASSKTGDFNSNATSKTGDFNTNATNKTNSFNQNASDKTTAFNNNYDAKIAAFDDHVSGYAAQIDNLEEVVGIDTDTFSTSSTYAVGDVVVYDNKFYRCKTAITTAGAWDSSKWDEINVRQELDEKETRIQELEESNKLIISNYDTDTAIGSDLNITDSLNGYAKSVVCGNTTQVQTTGKNKFDDSVITNIWVGTNGTISAVNGANAKKINCSAGDSFTLSAKYEATSLTNAIIIMAFYDENDNLLARYAEVQLNLLTISKTAPANTAYGYFGRYTLAPTEIQLESGLERSDYEPYTSGQPSPSPSYPQNIVDVSGTQTIYDSNKNLFNMFDFTGSHVKFEKLDGKMIDLKANTTVGAQFAINYVRNINPNKTYNVSFKIKKINFGQGASSGSATVYTYGSNDGTNYSRINAADVVQGTVLNQEYSFSKQVTGYSSYRFYFYNVTGQTVPLDCETQYYDIQFEEGSTATDFVEHTGQNINLRLGDIHLRKIGDYQDKIYKGNGKWWLYKEIGDVTLDGSSDEDIVDNGIAGDLHEYRIEPTPAKVAGRFNLISNYFTNTTSNTQRVLGSDSSQRIFFRILQETASSVTAFKTWLSNNNTTVCYILETPTTTEITSTNYPELYADLQELEKMQTYKGGTSIVVTASSGNPAILEVTYYKDDTVQMQQDIANLKAYVLSQGANI